MAESQYARDLRQELKEIDAELKAQRVNGQEHSLTGSHARRGVSYTTLNRRRQQIISSLAALKGGRHALYSDSG